MTEPGIRYLVWKNPNDCFWGVMTGTSMASPTVAGIIAQWLQIKPDLCPGDIKRIIAETAIKDDFTANPDSYFRYGPNGKIDALAGARYILSLIEEPEDPIIMGDVNGSGTISIADVTLMIDYILRLEVEGFIYEAGDLNQDGNVSIPDVTELIDIINFKDDVSF